MNFRRLASLYYGAPVDPLSPDSDPAPGLTSSFTRMKEFSRLEPFCQSPIGALGLSLLQSSTLPSWPGVTEPSTGVPSLARQEDEHLSQEIESFLSNLPEELRLSLQSPEPEPATSLAMMRLSSSSPSASTPDSSFTLTPTMATVATEVYPSPPCLSNLMPDSSASKGEVALKKKRPGRFPCLYPGCNKDFTAKFSVKRHARKHLEEKTLTNSPSSRAKTAARRQGESDVLFPLNKRFKALEEKPISSPKLAWGA